ncbi:GcvT family protein [Agrobacterium cavarae]|uniref:GcvT family protein n=1 Tax=Agrobacterium cavarae TaxID=2528239 RepID=UPI003FD325BF
MSDSKQPTHARVIIIGGGIIGTSILYHLAKAGWNDVVLLEWSRLTAGSTWHAAANGNTFNGSPLLAWSMKRTFELWSEIQEETGQDVGAHLVGGVMIARTQARLDELNRLRGVGKRIGVDYQMLSKQDLLDFWPVLNTDSVLGAMYDPMGGHVDPYGLTMAYAKGGRMRGARILEGWKVDSLIQTAEGGWIVSGPQGTISADIIINAAGLYADEVAKMTGARLPMINMRHHYLITEPIPEVQGIVRDPPTFRDVDAGVYGRREGGGILFGIYEADSRDFGVDKMPESFDQQLFEPDLDRLLPSLEHVFEAIPCIGETGIKSVVHGPFVFSPDQRPLLGWMPHQKNHFCAAGFLAGISMSGGFGQLIAEWIVEGAPHRDLSSCDVLRYGDWAIGDYTRGRSHDAYAKRYKIHFPNEEVLAGRPVRVTPMHERYEAMGACFGIADGWERPNWFAGEGQTAFETGTFRRSEAHEAVGRECQTVRDHAGYTDLISFANYLVEGEQAIDFLRRALPGRVPNKDGRLALSPVLDVKGGLLGDMTVLRLKRDKFMLVGSGALSRIHLRQILPLTEGLDVSFTNRTEAWTGFSVAGPKARRIMEKLGIELPTFFGGADVKIGSISCTILRLSYVGELSYEIHCALEDQVALHDQLLKAATDADVEFAPFGARAMNSMRVEKGLPRTGDELNAEISIDEAGLEWMLDRSNNQFQWQDGLSTRERKGKRLEMRTIKLDEYEVDPTGGEPLFSGTEIAGYISSASYGHRVGAPLAIAFIKPQFSGEGTKLVTWTLGAEIQAKVLKGCAYDPSGDLARS